MAGINRNSDTAKEIRQALALQSGQDETPVPFPVVNVNPKSLRILNNVKQVSTATTIYTVPAVSAKKRALLQGGHIIFAKDTTDTGTVASIVVTPKGQAIGSIFTIASITLTAHNDSKFFALPAPVELEPGTTVALSLSGTFTISRANAYITEEDVKGD